MRKTLAKASGSGAVGSGTSTINPKTHGVLHGRVEKNSSSKKTKTSSTVQDNKKFKDDDAEMDFGPALDDAPTGLPFQKDMDGPDGDGGSGGFGAAETVSPLVF